MISAGLYNPLTSWPNEDYYNKFTPEYLIKLRASWDQRHSADGTIGYTESHLKILGLRGEVNFARLYGLEVDEEYYRDGDGGVDFAVPFGTIDVKTFRWRPWISLLHKTKKPIADIVVLQLYDIDDDYFIFAGWATREDVLAAPVKFLSSDGVSKNYCIEQHDLRHMSILDKMFKDARQGALD